MPIDFNNTKEEYEKKDKCQIESDFDKIRELLQKKPNGYHEPYILRQMHEKPSLRKTYLSVVKNSPARISEISEDALLTKPTCYSQLYKLLEMNIVERLFVMDVMSGKVKNKGVKDKFEAWVTTMNEKLKRYYLAKTSYWVITDFGKKFASRTWKFEQEFKINEEKEDLYIKKNKPEIKNKKKEYE